MKLNLPDGPFEAYLFDCDGTIVDSMPLHYLAWKRIFREYGCDFTEEKHYSWGGMPTEEIIATLNAEQGLTMEPVAVALRKEEYYYEIIHQLEAVPEVLEHIEDPWEDSVCGGLGRDAGLGDAVAVGAEYSGQV